MEESELMQKVRAGEKDAFEKWMDIYSGDIERFVIQYGCTLKQAADLAEETFRNLHNQLDSISNEESLVCTLYKKALKSLAFVQQTDAPNETLFPFEEDQELHDQIGNLEMEYKIPFILSQFHKLDDSEIVKITDTSLETVEQAITVAFRDMGDAQLKKRLEFLNKSYGRMKSSFRKEQVFAKSQKELLATGKLKQSISKKPMISWIAGTLILLSLILVPVVTSEEYKMASDEKYLEQLGASFEKEIGYRYTELGLKESTEEDILDFNPNQYGKQQREDFESMVRRYEKVLTKTGTLNKKRIKKDYQAIIKSLELPSEMTAQLFKNPLTDDVKKSDEFMKRYLKQFTVIQQSYYTVLFKSSKIIEDEIVDGELDIDKFMEKKDTYPEELQLALNGMSKQNIYPESVTNWGAIVPVFQKNKLGAKIRSSIHPDLGGFLTVMEVVPLLTYPGLAHSLADSIDYLLEIEKTLLATTLNDEATNHLSWTYSELFHEISGGADPDNIFGTDGVVKDEFREGWKRITSAKEGSPTAFIMQIIISEMEATDWTGSKSLKRLGVYDVQQALELAKIGKLETFSLSSDYAN
ncbi:hypothetical protein H7992_05765 [Sporosarcina sp. resist]|uniref:RNA polymerase sigma factor n=1 Tax=Sporosarcina sp. resist TaxID=2762563 RepID=UPI00164E6BED|nr:hypothetical protein [Sporosarcina sp. resist]QNK89212.1 hypothetical protein H7992_05765 [Sporosarcina sp. resist]